MYLAVSTVVCAAAQPPNAQPEAITPKVFLIGQYEAHYNAQVAASTSLVRVCDNDVRKAYGYLRQMAIGIQKLAFAEGFDLNGVKCWIHFFWNPDGSIKYIAFYLKPSSKNVSAEALSAFFTRFANSYHLPVQTFKPFQLYTSLSFPVLKLGKVETLRATSTQY